MRKAAISSDQMYAIEERASSVIRMPRFLMMENAGGAVADYVVSKFPRNLSTKKILVICGTGNNGGDGVVAARHLASYGARPSVVLLGGSSKIRTEEALMNWSIARRMEKSLKILPEFDTTHAQKADIIIDAIFGTGIKGEIGHPYSDAIRAINASKAFTVAVDVPSGLDPNTGVAADPCVKADTTITFHRVKYGIRKARQFTGAIRVVAIGIPPEAEEGIVNNA